MALTGKGGKQSRREPVPWPRPHGEGAGCCGQPRSLILSPYNLLPLTTSDREVIAASSIWEGQALSLDLGGDRLEDPVGV